MVSTQNQHPNVVRLLGSYEQDDCAHLVLDACLGGSLHELLHPPVKPGIKLEPIPERNLLHWCDSGSNVSNVSTFRRKGLVEGSGG